MNLKFKGIGIATLCIATLIPTVSILSLILSPKILAEPPQFVGINYPTETQTITTSDFTVTGGMLSSPYDYVYIDVYVDDLFNQTVQTNGIGEWTADLTGIPEGNHNVTVRLHRQQNSIIANSVNNNLQVYNTEFDIFGETIISEHLTGTTGKLGISQNGSEVWIPISDGTVQVFYNPYQQITQTINVAGTPNQVVFSHDGSKAYVVSASNRKIFIINRNDYSLIHTINLASTPDDIVISQDDSTLFVLTKTNGALTRINTTTYVPQLLFPFVTDISRMVLSNDGLVMYLILDNPGRIVSVDPNTEFYDLISFDYIDGVNETDGVDMVLNSTDTNLYILDNSYKIYNLPVANGVFNINDAHTAALPDIGSPQSLFLSGDEKKLYITDPANDELEWIDALSNTPTPTIVADSLLASNTYGVSMPDLTTPLMTTEVNFTVLTTPDITPPSDPGTPTTTSPTSNRRPTWTWTPSTDAFGIHWYSYILASDAGFANVAEMGSVFSNTYTPGFDLAYGTWYFEVMAWDNNDNHTSFFPNSGTVVFTPTFTAPATDSKINLVNINFNFPQSTKAGSKKIIFTPVTPSGSDKTMTLTDDSVANFTYDPHTLPGDNVHVVASDFFSLDDGIYDVKLEYSDNSDYITTITHTNITIDTVTQSAPFISPVTGQIYLDYLPIQFTLPEAPLADSLQLVLLNSDSGDLTHVTLNQTGITAGVSQEFTLDTLNLTGDSHIIMTSPTLNAIPNGRYTVVITYQDQLANPATATVKGNVYIGYAGPHIRFTAPTTNSTTTITDTQIKVISEVNVLAANVTVDPSTTSSYSDLNCTQTSARVVDCTVKISSTGNFVLKATDANDTTTATKVYTITTNNSSGNQNNSQNQNSNNEGDATTSATTGAGATTPVSAPVKTVTPVSATNSTITPVNELLATNANSEIETPTPNFPWWIFIPIILGIGGVGFYIKKKGSKDTY